jgi:hypothetical protein
VASTYHLNSYSNCVNSPLRISGRVLEGNYASEAQHWNDTTHHGAIQHTPLVDRMKSSESQHWLRHPMDTLFRMPVLLNHDIAVFLPLYSAAGRMTNTDVISRLFAMNGSY